MKGTLEGDVITVKTKDAQKLSSLLAKMVDIRGAHIVEDGVEITVRDGRTMLPKIVDLATMNKVEVESVSLREPTLEDVFMHYTGRAIRAEGSNELRGLSAIRRRAIK